MSTEALSITTFNIDRFTTLEEFLSEYREIGLSTMELNGRVPQFVIDGLLPLIDRGELKISSLHNFCPKPEVDEKELLLSSLDEDNRKKAVELTIKTIETAERVGARGIVVHSGTVEGISDINKKLIGLFRDGKKDSPEYDKIKTELIERRRKERHRYDAACEKSLYELSDFISRKNYQVRLGLENRYNYYQIPLYYEYDEWFDKYEDLPIYLWYDFGHGEALHTLSLINKYELLQKHGKRLLGFHIHDCIGIDDHKVPGTGSVDFMFVKDYLRPDIIKVLEYGRRFTLCEIKQGIEYLKSVGLI